MTLQSTAVIEPTAVLDEVRNLLPLWAERAAAADAEGRIARQTADELAAIGAHRLLQPQRHGGAAAPLTAYCDTVALVGEACASAAWCLSVWSAHNWMVGLFGPEAQDEVWGADPAARISASIVPRRRFTRTAAGDVVIDGSFPFGSGGDHADWFGVGGIGVGPDGSEDRFIALLPAEAVTLDHDSWQVMGLRGGGSKDFTVTGPTVVPAHRVLSMGAVVRGCAPGQGPGHEAIFANPFRPVATIVLAPPALGAARAALARFVERTASHTVGPARTSQRHDPAAGLRIAESSAEIDAAGLVLAGAAAAIDRFGERRAAPTALEAATILRDTAFAVRLCARAVDRLYEASGGSALSNREPMQRYWRDVHAARTHTVLTWDGAANDYAAAVCAAPG